MLTVKGTHNEAVVFTDRLDSSAEGLLKAACNAEYLADCKIRIMPDVHAGKGCTIGTTMTIHDKVVPNMVGVDIGCGMETVKLKEKRLDFTKLDSVIRKFIPFGREICAEGKEHSFAQDIDLTQLRCDKHGVERAYRSIGTLGGGNHFIEVDKNKAAVRAQAISHDMAYVSGTLFDDYIHDMKLTQQFAVLNRKAMVQVILKKMKLTPVESFTTIHNYIDTDAMILRKGAVSARKGEPLLIPINMRDGSLLCVGKGNDDWNQSAPHGAGRLMSRKEARNTIPMKDYKAAMEGIFTTCVSKDTIDEAPMAYKSMEDIVKYIEPTADIVKIVKPVYNFKAEE